MKAVIWTDHKVFRAEVPNDSTYGHAVVIYGTRQLEGDIDTLFAYGNMNSKWVNDLPVVKPISHPKNNRGTQYFFSDELEQGHEGDANMEKHSAKVDELKRAL